MASFCLLRMGAPHCGHAALVELMLGLEQGEALVLVGSADVSDRPDTPLPWEQRRAILLALLSARGAEVSRLTFAPLPELQTNGWDARWCEYLLETAKRALVTSSALTRYVYGDDYSASVFAPLVFEAPSLELVRAARLYDKSSHELRTAITTGDPGLVEKYLEELAFYPHAVRAHVARVCRAGVERPR